jgi:inner membrane protein
VPSILTHPAVPLGIALACGSRLVPPRLIVAGVAASILPDLDVIGLHFGIAYDDAFGHRGFSHSIAFALALGALSFFVARSLRASPRVAAIFIFTATVSHPLLDMFTNGGMGVALFWPLTEARLVAPIRMIEVSPLSIAAFFGPAGVRVMASELLWVWLPVMGLATVAWGARSGGLRQRN